MSNLVPPSPECEKSIGEPEVLLQLGPINDEPFLRADAARNRARLIAEHGVAGVTMEALRLRRTSARGRSSAASATAPVC